MRTVETDEEKETGLVTAVLGEAAAGFKAGTAQAELVFSRNAYDLCLPVSALRQDGQGSYVLAVEETQNAFGLSFTALRVPVTVKEVDSGGQYRDGTTDITRTVVLGPVTQKEKKYFTAVLRGHLNLAAAKFRYGCTGLNLDALARGPLWAMGGDYNHGTGHGVGYLLNVHEGPQSFRWKNLVDRPAPVLEEGMITSDEPGYYAENEFGIRHENLVVCKKAEKTAYGQFMKFEPLTLVPFDLEGIDPEQMETGERTLLNQYHAFVYEKISPYLDEDEKGWLKEATQAI